MNSESTFINTERRRKKHMENLTRKKERSPPEKAQNLESTFRALPKNKKQILIIRSLNTWKLQ